MRSDTPALGQLVEQITLTLLFSLDYQRSLGSPITVKLYAPLKGKKEYTGELLSYTPDSFTISVKGEEMTFQKKDASKVQPYIDFKALEKDLDELEADFENIETEEEN